MNALLEGQSWGRQQTIIENKSGTKTKEVQSALWGLCSGLRSEPALSATSNILIDTQLDSSGGTLGWPGTGIL